MTLGTAVWRRFPVRGGGRLLIPRLERRAARAAVVTGGPFGTQIEVDPRQPAELSLYLWGTCVPEVEAAVGRLLGPGCTAIDVATGTGTGVVAVMMAARCHPGRVIAIEPSREIGARIARQAQRSGVSSELEVVPADPLALDSLGELAGTRIDLMRVMTGGGPEPAVLRGARAMLSAARPALLFDWCPNGWRAAREPPAAVADLLAELGYELFAPRFREHRWWSVAPIGLEGFEPVSTAALRDGSLPEGILVATTRSMSARLA